MNRQEAKNAKRVLPEPPDELDSVAHVIGAAFEVHRHLGPGFLESVYEEALAIEFALRKIPHARQRAITVDYVSDVKGHDVGESRPDFLVQGRLVVEIKAVVSLAPVHKAQVISYLKAVGQPLGLLLNFRVYALKQGGIKRVVLSSLN